MNQHLPRWVRASFLRHFNSKKQNLKLRFEGADRLNPKNDAAEFRMDGPDETRHDRLVADYAIFVNMLITTISDENYEHKEERHIGIIAAAFENSIPIYKLGKDAQIDTGVIIGCAILKAKIDITRFGAVEGFPNIMYATVEGDYCLTLTEELT